MNKKIHFLIQTDSQTAKISMKQKIHITKIKTQYGAWKQEMTYE